MSAAAAGGGSRKQHIVAVIHRSSSKQVAPTSASAGAGDDDEGVRRRVRVCAEFAPARYPFKFRKHTCSRCGAARADHKARPKPKPTAEAGGSTAEIREEDLPPRKRLLLRFQRCQALAAASVAKEKEKALAAASAAKEKEKALADAAAAAEKAREKEKEKALTDAGAAAAAKAGEKETEREMGEELEEGEIAWTPEAAITSKGKRTPRRGWATRRRLD